MLQIRILILVVFITIVNYFDRSAISFAILPIEQELRLSDGKFGLILGAFGIGYLVMSFVSGFIIHRFGVVRTWAVGAAFWSLCTISFAFAKGFWTMLILRVLLGLAEGLHFPALLQTVSDWLRPSFRARAVALSLVGVPVASLIGAPLLTFLIKAFSWHWMFIIMGGLGLIWVAFWSLNFLHQKNPHHGAVLQSDGPETFWEITKQPPFVGSCIAYFAFGYLVFFGLFWLPGFLEKQVHISMQNTGTLLMIPWGFSALMILLGGFISDWLWKKTGSFRKARSYLVIIGLFLAGISFSGIAYTSNIYAIATLLSLGLGFGFLMNSPIYALNVDFFPKRAAMAQGIMTGFFALAGIIAPTVTGFLVEWSGTFNAAFLLMALICGVGALAVFVFQKQD